MRLVAILITLSLSLFAKWQMFQGNENTFIFNEETGEVFRHFQVVGNNQFLQEEGFIRVKFTTYAKYPFGSTMRSPTGNNPAEMKKVENKILDRLSKE